MPRRGSMRVDTTKGGGKVEDASNIELRETGSSSTSASSTPSTPAPPKKEKVSWKDLPQKDQLTILVLARLAEPLVQTSLQAYMFYQLKSFDTTLSDATVASQAGILQASFSAAQTLTGVFWGRIADTYGRKTVLLLGSLGTIFSCLGFGLSRSFVFALVFRCLGGLVNGNIAVMRVMVSEIIKEKKYQARAFLLLPMCFNVGVIIGPVMGGMLADPVRSYPGIFGVDSILGGKVGVRWMIYWPYLAPNLMSALIVSLSLATIFFGLNETLSSVKDQPDRGRAMGQRLWSSIYRKKHHYVSLQTTDERDENSDQEQREGLLKTEAREEDVEAKPRANSSKPRSKKLPFSRIWTTNVLFTLLAHFTTAFHLGTFNNLWFIFLSADRYKPAESSPANYHPHGPFVFTGGLGMPPRLVGIAMAILGVIGITLQLFIYPRLNDKYGVIPLYRIFVYGFPIAYVLAPYLSIVSSKSTPPAPADGPQVWLALCGVLLVQVLGRTFVLPSTMILINNCSPHPSVLGTIHGIAQSVGSAARTFGPAVAGYLFGAGLNIGVVGLSWWILAAIAAFGVLASTWVREGSGHEIVLDDEDEEEQEQEISQRQERGRVP